MSPRKIPIVITAIITTTTPTYIRGTPDSVSPTIGAVVSVIGFEVGAEVGVGVEVAVGVAVGVGV